MRIEKTETVELLDWENENGLEIVVFEEGHKYEACVFGFLLKERSWDVDKDLDLYRSTIAVAEGDTKEDALKNLCIKISKKSIVHHSIIISKRHSKFRTLDCPLLVHTKLVGSEAKPIEKEPPIDAEGWVLIDEVFSTDEYKTIIYKNCSLRFYKIGQEKTFFLIFPTADFTSIKVLTIDLIYYKYKANLKDTDDLETKCFKIANYICSRLCDKIESN